MTHKVSGPVCNSAVEKASSDGAHVNIDTLPRVVVCGLKESERENKDTQRIDESMNVNIRKHSHNV